MLTAWLTFEMMHDNAYIIFPVARPASQMATVRDLRPQDCIKNCLISLHVPDDSVSFGSMYILNFSNIGRTLWRPTALGGIFVAWGILRLNFTQSLTDF